MTVIALLTDFGVHDPYVAAMKGVILSRCDARVIDLTHDIAPYDIFGAAWFLRSTVPWFDGGAKGSIFVSVVDPGVGSGRRILAVSQDGLTFLAPDNGLLSLVLSDAARIRSVENETFFLPDGSSTFHGRDRFAPLAAALVKGASLDDLGPHVAPSDLVKLAYDPPEADGDVWRGSVVAVDRFGNVITDLEVSRLGSTSLEVMIGSHHVSTFAENYLDGSDEPFLIAGSGGTLEVSIRSGSAADILHIARFDRVEARVTQEQESERGQI